VGSSSRSRSFWALVVVLAGAGWALWLQVEVVRLRRSVEVRSSSVDPGGKLRERVEALERQLASLETAGRLADPAAGDVASRSVDGSDPLAPLEPSTAERLSRLEERLDELVGPKEELGPTDADRARTAALNRAIERGDEGEVRRLLGLGVDLDRRDEDRRTALASASVAGDLELIDLLVQAGAGLERTSGRRSMTPLLAALDAVQSESALRLLELGAEPEAVDKNGESALIWAAFNGCTDVVRRLIDLGVRVDFRSHDGTTALLSAVRRGHDEIVRLLLEFGASPVVGDREGRTPLGEARRLGEAKIEALLIERGAR